MKKSKAMKQPRGIALALKAAAEWEMYFRSDAADYMAFAIPLMARDLAKLRAKVARQQTNLSKHCGVPLFVSPPAEPDNLASSKADRDDAVPFSGERG